MADARGPYQVKWKKRSRGLVEVYVVALATKVMAETRMNEIEEVLS